MQISGEAGFRQDANDGGEGGKPRAGEPEGQTWGAGDPGGSGAGRTHCAPAGGAEGLLVLVLFISQTLGDLWTWEARSVRPGVEGSGLSHRLQGRL